MPQWLTRHKWLWIVAAVLVVLLAFAACDDDEDDGETPPAGETPVADETPTAAGPLKIGILMAFTGDLGTYGGPISAGAELAVAEINAAGGVFGQDIEIATGDTATDASTGGAEATRLIEVEGVHAIVGALSSGVTISVAESVTVPSQILQISPASTAPTVTTVVDSDFLFRTPVSDETQGVALAFLAQDLGFTNVCTMFVNNDYGQGLSNVFTENFVATYGGTVPAEVPHEQEQTTYASELATCTGEGPEALAAIAYPESAGVFLREAVEGGLVDDFLFVDGTKQTTMFEDLGWDVFDGAYGTAPGGPTSAGEHFDSAYEAAEGETPPLPFMREAYDAVYTIALAAEKAQSTDSTAIRDALRDVANPPGDTFIPGTDDWAEAVAAVRAGEDINYEGAAGAIDFDANGDVVGTIEVWRVDAATQDLVTERVLAVDLATKEVTDVTP
jgi:branched-chain amino acid transport system substrate-binding protein